MNIEYRVGHVIDELRKMPDESIQMVVTSPPYWGLRKYSGEQDVIWGGVEGCEHEWGEVLTERVDDTGFERNRKGLNKLAEKIDGNPRVATTENPPIEKISSFCQLCGAWKGGYGLEPSIELYVQHTVEILREIRRVLRKDGVVFWNIGDSYSGSGGAGGDYNEGGLKEGQPKYPGRSPLKPKDMCLIPFRVALAVQADGWWCRSDIVWSKPNPMPESCTDRPTKSHEYIFLFTKNKDYYWDQEAVREPCSYPRKAGKNHACDNPHTPDPKKKQDQLGKRTYEGFNERYNENPVTGRNIRTVWTINPQPYPEAHFATYPEEIPRRCIKAGSSERGCCPKCGSPWARKLERTGRLIGEDRGGDYRKRDIPDDVCGKKILIGGAAYRPGSHYEMMDLGWSPSCGCDAGEPVPCTILDPFAGSGTTLRVARDLNRSAIGIDISNNYKELAVKRADLNISDVVDWAKRME